MQYVRYFGFGCLCLVMGPLLVIGLGGGYAGWWATEYWDLELETWGFWTLVGGIAAQVFALVAYVIICKSLRGKPL